MCPRSTPARPRLASRARSYRRAFARTRCFLDYHDLRGRRAQPIARRDHSWLKNNNKTSARQSGLGHHIVDRHGVEAVTVEQAASALKDEIADSIVMLTRRRH